MDGKKYITPSGAAIILICFFLPWVQVSCVGEISGAKIGGEMWIVFAAALIVIATFFIFKSVNKLEKSRSIIIVSLIIGLSVIIIRYIDTAQKLGYDLLGLEIKYGGVLTLIGFVVSFIGTAFLKSEEEFGIGVKNDRIEPSIPILSGKRDYSDSDNMALSQSQGCAQNTEQIVSCRTTVANTGISRYLPISIITKPSDARVQIDGIDVESKIVKVAVGKHQITVEKEGFSSVQSEIDVSETAANEFFIELCSAKGSITIETEMPGIPIIINKEPTEKVTPCRFDNIIPNKKYDIYVAGREEYSDAITLSISENEYKTIQLKTFKWSKLTINTAYCKLQFVCEDKDYFANANNESRIRKGEYNFVPTYSFLPPIKLNIDEGSELIINYDDVVAKREIIVNTGNYDIEAEFRYSNEDDLAIPIVTNKTNLVLPGSGELRFLGNKYKNTHLVIDDNTSISIDLIPEIEKNIRGNKRFNLMLYGTIATVIITMAIIILTSHLKSERIWLDVKNQESIEIISDYIETYPKSKHLSEAIKLHEDWTWRDIEKFPMAFVEGGTFQMGSTTGDSDEKPVHSVTVSNFFIGKYEVTQKEYQAVMGTNPSRFKGDNLPVETVSWYNAVDYCNKLSLKEGLPPVYSINGNHSPADWSRGTIKANWTANGYRLPTEAEWEYAARGGNKSQGYTYSGSNNIGNVAWYGSNSGNKTNPVGRKGANELGIYDMSGNVWEWCWDWYGGYTATAQSNPRGPASGESAVLRGGSWDSGDYGCRVALRAWLIRSRAKRDLGFRVSRTYD